MDVALYHSTIDSSLSAFFDAVVLCISKDLFVDSFLGSIGDGLDVFVENRFLESLVSNTNLAESSECSGINYMESKVHIGKAEQNFHDGRTQHLIGTHTICPTPTGRRPICAEVLQHVLTNGRLTADDVADDFKLLGLGVITFGVHQRHLLLPLLAHSAVSSFRVCVVILDGCRFLTYYTSRGNATE